MAEIKDIFNFLADLSRNNNREWFNANKERYMDVKKTVEIFTSRLINVVREVDPAVGALTPADCTYRIYRDTRFSKDKTPYKTHIGIFIAPGGKKTEKAGYYFHLQPGECFFGGGCWCPEPALLKAIRTDIFENVEEYLEIINNPVFKKIFPEVGYDRLKNPPKGFPADWEFIDLLKPRDYTVGTHLPDSFFLKKDVMPALAKLVATLKPLNDFYNFAIDPGQ